MKAFAPAQLCDPQFVQRIIFANLALVGVQQDGGATAAGVVHGVLARH